MITANDCQFDFYEDLDIIIDARVEVEGFSEGIPGNGNGNDPANEFEPCGYNSAKIVLNINGTEIELEGEASEKALKAIDIRLQSRLKEKAAAIHQDRMIAASEERMRNRMEDILFMKRGA